MKIEVLPFRGSIFRAQSYVAQKIGADFFPFKKQDEQRIWVLGQGVGKKGKASKE